MYNKNKVLKVQEENEEAENGFESPAEFTVLYFI